MVLLPSGVNAQIEAGSESITAAGDSLTIVPPGSSRITLRNAGYFVRICSEPGDGFADRASNKSHLRGRRAGACADRAVARSGRGLSAAPLSARRDGQPDPSPLKMRLFRSTNLMINVFLPWPQPRDETKLSPHAHDDFEQISLALEGTFAHHLRYPWTPDKTTWRDDEHVVFGSPSLLVIPARVIHTSHNIGDDVARLVDIFAPPRLDFSRRDGFVLNANDYPMP